MVERRVEMAVMVTLRARSALNILHHQLEYDPPRSREVKVGVVCCENIKNKVVSHSKLFVLYSTLTGTQTKVDERVIFRTTIKVGLLTRTGRDDQER